MPQLDYGKASNRALGTNATAHLTPRFYDGSEGRELVTCPRCLCSADKALGGDHGGQCPPASEQERRLVARLTRPRSTHRQPESAR